MTYTYKTSICTFTIAPLPNGDFGVYVDGDPTCYNGAHSIEALIDDINSGITGWESWDDDRYLFEGVPTDISEWEQG